MMADSGPDAWEPWTVRALGWGRLRVLTLHPHFVDGRLEARKPAPRLSLSWIPPSISDGPARVVSAVPPSLWRSSEGGQPEDSGPERHGNGPRSPAG